MFATALPAITFAVIAGILWASATLWLRAILVWRSGQALLPSERVPPVPWGLIDLGIALGIWLVGSLFTAILGQTVTNRPSGSDLQALSPAEQIPLLWMSGLATLTICTLIAGALFVRHRVSLAELGWVPRFFAGDVVLGLKAFIMLAPIVYALQLFLTQLVESKHPLVEMLKRNPSPGFFLVASFAAVVVAPLAEEFLFRVLLQGWLERLFAPSNNSVEQLVHGGRQHDDSLGDSRDVMPLEGVDPELPASSPRAAPVLVSAAFFALAHWSHGPDPIPLFLLALGLGYLYQRTHRILPCILLHFLLNLCSLAALGMAVFAGRVARP